MQPPAALDLIIRAAPPTNAREIEICDVSWTELMPKTSLKHQVPLSIQRQKQSSSGIARRKFCLATVSYLLTHNIGISLSMFILSVFLSGQAGNYLGPRKRKQLRRSSIIQTVFEFIAAGIQSAGPSPVEDADGHALAVISLLAFSFGA
jgi:hypothetical protein